MMHSTPLTSYATRALLMLAAIMLAAGPAGAQAPLLKIQRKFDDPPLPAPCAAEGVCRPKRDTFGYYRPRWRRWPGEPAAATPTDTTDAGQLPDIEEINPKNEDREAPPPSEEREPESGIDYDAGAPPQLPPLFDRPGAEEPGDADDGRELPALPRLQPLSPLREAGPGDGASTGHRGVGPRVANRLPELNQSPAVRLHPVKPSTGVQPTVDLPPAFPESLQLPSPASNGSASHRPTAASHQAVVFATDLPTQQQDSVVRQANAAKPKSTGGSQAFYQPDSPPAFNVLGFESN